MSRIKVGDTVTMNRKAAGLGEALYAMDDVFKGLHYKVVAVLPDNNAQYGGEIHLEGHEHMPFIAEDFDVVAQQ